MRAEFKDGRIYPKSFNEAWKDHQERYNLALSYIKEGDAVLDVACGVGYGAYYLAVNTSCRSVTAIDISDSALDWAQKYFSNDKVTFCKSNLEKEFTTDLPVTQFDVITSFETIEHLKEDKSFLQSLHKVLKPGSILLISSPNEDLVPYENNPFFIGGKNPDHYRHYRTSEFEQLLQDYGFFITERYTQYANDLVIGSGGCLNLFVCTNIPSEAKSITDFDEIIQACFRLKETNDKTGNNLVEILEFVSPSKRFDQMLLSYEHLAIILDLIKAGRFEESLDYLTTINEWLCPERYFFEGLVYQGKGEYHRAVDSYSKVLSTGYQIGQDLVSYTQQQLKQLANEVKILNNKCS